MRATALGTTVIVLLLAMTVAALPVFAGAIQDRMKSRLPVIRQLKSQGAVGENNRGYLEFRGSQRPQANVVAAENADRSKVYNAIAAKTGTTAAVVGNRRAAQLAQQARRGDWLQNAKGQWYRK